MGLRINQNIDALNSYRNLSVTQGAMSKSLEKLSSGYRINRAADDAAGLAISEGLRSQIGGLKVAVRNTQDGISVVQTAEGALTESHSILQRLRDLSVQSANDSNDDNSRNAINAEATALKSELDRIAEKTTFNNVSLLNGDFAGKKFQVGYAANDVIGVNIGIETATGAAAASYSKTVDLAKDFTPAAATAATGTVTGDFKANFAPTGATQATVSLAHDKANFDGTTITHNEVTIGGLSFEVNVDETGMSNTQVRDAYQAAYDTAKGTWDTAHPGNPAEAFTFSYDGTDLTAKSTTTGVAASAPTLSVNGVSANGTAGADAIVRTKSFTLDGNTFGVNADLSGATNQQISDAFQAAYGGTAYNFSYDGTDLKVTSANIGADADAPTFSVGSTTGTVTAGKNAVTALSFKVDNVNVTIGGDLTGTDGDVTTALQAAYDGAKGVDDAAYTFTYAAGKLTVTGATTGKNSTGPSVTGDLAGGVAKAGTDDITYKAFNTEGLGLDSLDLSSAQGAQDAIDLIDNAIKNVSTARANLGALQNRFEHTINNLNVTSENLTASESRIRDTDMAMEMMSFTRSQILSQAGTAMLAQANQAPQGVLSLLR